MENSPTATVRSRAGFALFTLIAAACVANLNLAVANVALPDIGRHFEASQASLNLVAVGFTLGLAGSVLYLGAIGDHHGRRRLLVIGLIVSIPAAACAAWAPSMDFLIISRLVGGIAAGMVYPTTLSIIVTLYTGKKLVTAIALWSGIGAGVSSLGPTVVGWLLTFSWWGSGFAITIPLAAIALVLVIVGVPASTCDPRPVDNFGGVLSVIFVASLILAISFAPQPGLATVAAVLGVIAIATCVLFVRRQLRVANPLFDFRIARDRIFWVAAVAGLIVFGSLMGSFFIGQQFLQDVMGYSTLSAGLAILPSAIAMVVLSPVAALVINRVGSRITLLIGFALLAAGFIGMFVWQSNSPYWVIGVSYASLGAGVAMAASPASRAVMAAVPPNKAGMGSATNDLQRDLGGAIMQSVMGSLLVVKYSADLTASLNTVPESERQSVSDQAVALMTQSFAGAESVAAGLPQVPAQTLMGWAQTAFLQGANWAFAFALGMVVVAGVLVAVFYPKHEDELHRLSALSDKEPAQ